MNTSFKICDIEFKNPIIGASGTFGFAHEYEKYMDINVLGAVSSKGLTLNGKDGNTGIRIHEVSSGIMNSIGLENKGVKFFIKYELPLMKKYDIVTIANLGGNDLSEYIEGASLLDKSDIDMIELNISCPNVKHGGMAFGILSDVAHDVVKQVRDVVKNKPLMVKLSPNAHDIVDMALNCEDAGADAISLVNTFNALAIDIKKRKPVFDNITAGLSGACIKPIALAMVYKVAKAVKVPVVGMGGISSAQDAIEFIMAGASAVQVGSANFTEPAITENIVYDLQKYMQENKIEDLKEIRGII